MDKNIIKNVWYTSSGRSKELWPISTFEDVGYLEKEDEEVKFVGFKKNILINKKSISNISVSKRKINYLSYVFLNCLYLFLQFIFIDNVIFSIAILILANLISLIFDLNSKWVFVEYFDEQNFLKKIYFTDGSKMGWSSLFGGEKKIINFLQNFNYKK